MPPNDQGVEMRTDYDTISNYHLYHSVGLIGSGKGQVSGDLRSCSRLECETVLRSIESKQPYDGARCLGLQRVPGCFWVEIYRYSYVARCRAEGHRIRCTGARQTVVVLSADVLSSLPLIAFVLLSWPSLKPYSNPNP